MNISVGLIVKDGHRYLTEWLSWYMCAGFTKFYIAAHNATEETLQWLNLASKNNLVFFIEQDTVEGMWTQHTAYKRILNHASDDEVDLVLFVDIDEFLIDSNQMNFCEYDLLNDIANKQNVGQISLYSRVFGTSNHEAYDPEPVTLRFNRYGHYMGHTRQHIKSCVLINAVDFGYKINKYTEFVHFFPLKEGFITVDQNGKPNVLSEFNIDNFDGLVLNHYKTKSVEECLGKFRAGHLFRPSLTEDEYLRINNMSTYSFNLSKTRRDKLLNKIQELNKIIGA